MDMGQPEEAHKWRTLRRKPVPEPIDPVEVAKQVWAVPEETYGDGYRDHVLELYKYFADTTCRVADERGKASMFFLAGNSALVTAYGIAFAYNRHWMWQCLVPLIGITLCMVWNALITSYRNLNRGKYDVLREVEKKLPLALYTSEWLVLEEGKNKRTYRPLTHVEKVVPWLFVVLYAGLLVYALFGLWLNGGALPPEVSKVGAGSFELEQRQGSGHLEPEEVSWQVARQAE